MYQSMWDSRPMIHILPHWTHESGNIDVWLYSNCASVELFLNGTSLGKKALSQRGTKNQYAYTVAYAAGTIVANGYDSSRQAGRAGRAVHGGNARETGAFQRQDGGQYRVG